MRVPFDGAVVAGAGSSATGESVSVSGSAETAIAVDRPGRPPAKPSPRAAPPWPPPLASAPPLWAEIVVADVKAREVDAERAQRLAQLGVGSGKRLGGGGRLGGDASEQALGGLGQVDADLAELLGLQRDARLGEALAGGELDRAVEALDRLLQADAVAPTPRVRPRGARGCRLPRRA